MKEAQPVDLLARLPSKPSTSSLQISADLLSSRAGGLARYVDGLERALSRRSDVRVIGIGRKEDPRSVATDAAFIATRMMAIRRAVRGIPGHQIIATHFALYALPVLDQLRRRPHVVHFHGPWADESSAEGAGRFATAAKRWIERSVYATADRTIVLSHAFKQILVERYRVPADRIVVVPGGIDIPADPPPNTRQARERLGWPVDRPIVLCVRRLARRMGIDVLIDALSEVRRSVPEVLVMIAGRGALADELAARVERAGLNANVRLLGFVADDLLPLAYAAANVSIVPSQALEGFGLVTLESLVQGTPVLVTPVGGLPEAVSGLAADLVLADASVGAIADGLIRALTHPELLPSAERCRDYVERHFAWPRIAERVLDVYEEAAASG